MQTPLNARRTSLAILLGLTSVFFVPQSNATDAGGRARTPPLAFCPGTCAPNTDMSHGAEAIRLSARQLLKLIKKRTPMAPPGMLDKSTLRGKVKVEVCIDPSGNVIAVRAVKGHPLAVGSAIESVRSWSFTPYRIHGRAKYAVGLLTLRYDFRATDHSSPP
jgi:outer membrane biosynthesis protein TonB